MDFIALDVETANPRMSSICQIGIAGYKDGQVISEFISLVNPREEFSPINIDIHGITPAMVKWQPTLAEVFNEVCKLIAGKVVVCHTAFDRSAIYQAAKKNNLVVPDCRWLDSARVARRTWSAYANKGYGLSNLCKMLNYKYVAHNALEDAKAAGVVMLAAIKESGTPLEDWFIRIKRRLDGTTATSVITRHGNPDGPLYGEVVLFTGALQIPRSAAADMASKLGCEVVGNISKKVTLLVVGEQDLDKLNGHNKSTKHRKAEALIAQGVPIRILGEDDFNAMSLGVGG